MTLLIRTVRLIINQTLRQISHNIFILFRYLVVFWNISGISRQVVRGRPFFDSWIKIVRNLRLFFKQISLWLLPILNFGTISFYLGWNLDIPFWLILWSLRYRLWNLIAYQIFLFILLHFFTLLFVLSKKSRLYDILKRFSLSKIISSLLWSICRIILGLNLLSEPFRLNYTFTFYLRTFIKIKYFWNYRRLLHSDFNYLLFVFRR